MGLSADAARKRWQEENKRDLRDRFQRNAELKAMADWDKNGIHVKPSAGEAEGEGDDSIFSPRTDAGTSSDKEDGTAEERAEAEREEEESRASSLG